MKLFDRVAIVTIDTLEIRGLAITFAVKKNLTSKPNTVDLKIRNLTLDHRQAIAQKKVAKVQIETGYKDQTCVIFSGDLRTSQSVWEPGSADCVTALSAGDGEKAIRTSRVNVSLGKGTKTQDVLKAVVKALGVGEGNLSKALAKLQSSGIGDLFNAGTVLSGSAAKEMSAICRSSGLTWSVQNGALQILPLKEALAGTAVLVSQATGMVEAPTVDNKGVLTVKTLIIPDVYPGRLMILQADNLQGQYRIEECDIVGDTHGQDWYITSKAKRY